MNRLVGFLTAVLFAALAGQAACAQSKGAANAPNALESASALDDLPGLPPVPEGKTTILGGEIRNLDQVRDQFSLHIYGQRPMRILFDSRTQLYRDGKKIPLQDLNSDNYASVQTVLDGTNIFAVSIHVLSHTPEGELQGRVLNFNRANDELTVRSALSPEPVKLALASNVSIIRKGEPSFASISSGPSDLVAGALVSIEFSPGQNGRDMASRVAVLALPGSSFVFWGKVSFLDLHKGELELVDPRDGKIYQFQFDSTRIPESRNVHLNQIVTVRASYDGSQYTASEISVN